MSWKDALDMPTDLFYSFLMLIDRFSALEEKKALNIAAFPHLAKKKDKEKMVERINERAGFIKPKKIMSFDDLARMS